MNDYALKIENDILASLAEAEVSANEAAQFFGEQIEGMLQSPPNFNMFGKKLPIHIMRGYFPGTYIFFKLCLLNTTQLDGRNYPNMTAFTVGDTPVGDNYFAKVSVPRFKATRKKADSVYVSSKDIRKRHEEIFEKKLFDTENEITSLISTPVKRRKCMSPKGMPVFKLNKKRKRCAKKSSVSH